LPACVGEDFGGLCREATDSGSELLLVVLVPSSLQGILPTLAGGYEFFENAELDDVLETWPEPAAPDGDVEISRLAVFEATTVEHALQRIRLAVEVDVSLGVRVWWLPHEVVRGDRRFGIFGPKCVRTPAGGKELTGVVEVESMQEVEMNRSL